MNCNINKNNIPSHLWDTLSKIPIIWYMLPPVNTLQELYDKYDERDLVENNLVYVSEENTFRVWRLLKDKIEHYTWQPIEITSELLESLKLKADEQDITIDDKVIKLKDKKFSKDSNKGLGLIHLRPNQSEEGKDNILTMDMLNYPNTRIIIKDDFSIEGKDIYLPEGVILEFQGGSIKNGTLHGHDVLISNITQSSLADDLELEGTFYSEMYSLLSDNKKNIEHQLPNLGIEDDDYVRIVKKNGQAGIVGKKELADSFNQSIEGSFIRKDRPDSTEHKVTFYGGLETGEFLDSINYGTGGKIDDLGNAQLESLEVRGYVKILELIYNRLSAIEGDFVFTESGTIEEVTEEDTNTYRLKLRKRWDTDFTAFQKEDVLRGVVNDLTKLDVQKTAWFRVLLVDRIRNEIVVVLYPDDETPARKNFPPTEKMVLHRWGNSVHTDRQSTWYISSTEGRINFLSDVTKPILDDYNYASFWGKPPQLKVFEDKPINYDQPYFYARGLLVQDLIEVDYNGKPIRKIRDNGQWVENKVYTDGRYHPYYQDDVWHRGCRWRCIVEWAREEPRYNSSQWALLSGDTTLKLEIETDLPSFYRADSLSFNGYLQARVKRGDLDITEEIYPRDWQWTRETGNDVADVAWNAEHENSTSKIQITLDDMSETLNEYTKFKCSAYVRTEEGTETIDKEIII